MEGTTGGGARFFHGICRKKVEDLSDETSATKSLLDVIAFQIDVRVDFVRDAVVSLVAFESNIMSRRSDPKSFSIYREWRLPNTEMVARTDDIDGFGVSPAVVLRSEEHTSELQSPYVI